VLSGAKLAPVDDESRRTAPWVCTHEEWMERWAPRCPIGNQPRLLQILGFRLKGADCLQLRVALRDGEGVCRVMLEEYPDRIYVRAAACVDRDDENYWAAPSRHAVDCGVAVWLDAPLGERIVVDEDTCEELPLLFMSRGGTGEPCFYIPRPPGVLWPPDERTG
jgi:hypothetical protein